MSRDGIRGCIKNRIFITAKRAGICTIGSFIRATELTSTRAVNPEIIIFIASRTMASIKHDVRVAIEINILTLHLLASINFRVESRWDSLCQCISFKYIDLRYYVATCLLIHDAIRYHCKCTNLRCRA